MAIVIPFRAVRPGKGYAKRVASPPYDVVGLDEGREVGGGNPLSFLHVTRAEIDLARDVHPYDDRVYEKARKNYEKLMAEGILVQDGEPCYYVYCLKMADHEQCGIGACVHAVDFETEIVRKHEMTLPEKEVDRTKHIAAVHAQTGPIFLTYRSREGINRLVSKVRQREPEYLFVSDDGVRHSLWVVSGKDEIGYIEAEFHQVDRMYIADGHHRAAAGVAVAGMRKRASRSEERSPEYEYILAVLFPHDQLKIKGYNRVVKDLAGLTDGEFLAKVNRAFHVEADFRERTPKEKHEYGMYLHGKWFRLKVKEGSYRTNDIEGALDVAILQKNLFGPVLGIHNPRSDARIQFVGALGIVELERLVDSGAYAVAFSLFPATINQIMDVSDAGRIMPPKSTWFEPKLRDGILIHPIDDETDGLGHEGSDNGRRDGQGHDQGRRDP